MWQNDIILKQVLIGLKEIYEIDISIIYHTNSVNPKINSLHSAKEVISFKFKLAEGASAILTYTEDFMNSIIQKSKKLLNEDPFAMMPVYPTVDNLSEFICRSYVRICFYKNLHTYAKSSSNSKTNNYYYKYEQEHKILNLQPYINYNSEDIKKQYRIKCKEWHPDFNQSNLVKSEQQMKIINQAYSILKTLYK